MNIVLCSPSEIFKSNVSLRDERAKHIAKVLRSSVGDLIRVGVINGMIGTGVIKEIHKRPPYSVTLQLSLDTFSPTPSPIGIVLALPRPIMLKRVLSQATTLGVKNIYIINANRVEKSFWDSNLLDEKNYRKHLLSGLEQAIDTQLPTISIYKGFRTFIESEISEIKKNYNILTLADPRFSRSPCEVIPEKPERILLAIGPEGGWVDYEIDTLQQAGFVGFGIGPRILRVDSAVIAIHSMLTMLLR